MNNRRPRVEMRGTIGVQGFTPGFVHVFFWTGVTRGHVESRGDSPPRLSERASIRAKMECAWMLLVGRDVSVRLGLGGLPGRGGMRWVWDGGDAVGQGQRSSHNALHSCPSSRQPARCYANQPCGEPTTETCFHSLKYADTVKARAVTINQYRIDSWIVSDIFRMHRILSGIDSELRF